MGSVNNTPSNMFYNLYGWPWHDIMHDGSWRSCHGEPVGCGLIGCRWRDRLQVLNVSTGQWGRSLANRTGGEPWLVSPQEHVKMVELYGVCPTKLDRMIKSFDLSAMHQRPFTNKMFYKRQGKLSNIISLKFYRWKISRWVIPE